MKDTKNIIILALIIAILLMSVGYSTFATQLTLNGTAEIVGEWNIRIVNVEVQDASEGVEAEAPEYTNTTVNFNTKLQKPGDLVKYIITIENLGTIDATLENLAILIDEKNESPAISYIIQETPQKDLNAGEQTQCVLEVTYNEEFTETPSIKTKKMQGIIEYVQR